MLFSAVTPMLPKRLNYYLLPTTQSIAERCAGCQYKHDRLHDLSFRLSNRFLLFMFVTHFTLGYLLTIIFLPEFLLFAWITSHTKSDKLPSQTPEPIDLRELWTKIRPRSRRTSLPTVHPTPLERNPRLPSIHSLWENRQRNTCYPALHLSPPTGFIHPKCFT